MNDNLLILYDIGYFIIFNAKILVILVESADVTVTNVSIGDASTARNTYEENYPDSESILTISHTTFQLAHKNNAL